MLKIGDLGGAKLLVGTVGRTYKGTPAYMSPEQYKWKETDKYETNIDKPEPYSFNADVW